jgi:transposase
MDEIPGWWRSVGAAPDEAGAGAVAGGGRFAEGVPVREIAARLRVSRTAVFGWRQRWRGGEPALASKGPGGNRCRLNGSQVRRLADAPDEGPAVHGFSVDQRWTLARASDLIARMFPLPLHAARHRILIAPHGGSACRYLAIGRWDGTRTRS